MSRWAIITGASSGIGKALAFEFAGGGFNLVLISRNETALKEVADQCRQKRSIEVEVLAADLTDAAGLERAIATITKIPHRFEVLVNNAGFGIHGAFASTDIEENIRLINLQIVAALRLTHAVLPSMIESRRGRILNVASVYSFSPVPFQSVYAACKSFLMSFSTALQDELKDSGVTITIFCPGITKTEFRTRAGIAEKATHFGMTAEAAARIAYRSTLKGEQIVIPGWFNRLYALITRVLPAHTVPAFIRFINRHRGH